MLARLDSNQDYAVALPIESVECALHDPPAPEERYGAVLRE